MLEKNLAIYNQGVIHSTIVEDAKFLLNKYESLFSKYLLSKDSTENNIGEFVCKILKIITGTCTPEELINRRYLGVAYNFKKTPVKNLSFFLEKFKPIATRNCKNQEDIHRANEMEALYYDMNQFYKLCTDMPLDHQDPCFLVEKDFIVHRYFLLKYMNTDNPKEINQTIIFLLFYVHTKFFVSPYNNLSRITVMGISLDNDEYSIKALIGPDTDKKFLGIVNKNGKVIDDSSDLSVTKIVFGQWFSQILEHFGLEPLSPLPPFKQPLTLTSEEQEKIKKSSIEKFNCELSNKGCAVYLAFSTLKEAETFYIKYAENIYPIWDNNYKGGSYLPIIDSECIDGKFIVRIPTAAKISERLIRFTFEDFCKKSRLHFPALNEIPKDKFLSHSIVKASSITAPSKDMQSPSHAQKVPFISAPSEYKTFPTFQGFQIKSCYHNVGHGAHFRLINCDKLIKFLNTHENKRATPYDGGWVIFRFGENKYSFNTGQNTEGAVLELYANQITVFNNATTIKKTNNSQTMINDRENSLTLTLKGLDDTLALFNSKSNASELPHGNVPSM
jgi:hypothetical protein